MPVRLLLQLLVVALAAAATTSSAPGLDPQSAVTLVVTACKRPALLLALLDGLFAHEAFAFRAVLIAEASGVANANAEAVSKYPFVTVVGGPRRSQVDNIDAAYALVRSKYILHFEEDWVVHRGGFVQRSIAVLDAFPTVSVVSLHAVGSSEFQQIDAELAPGLGVGFMRRDTSGGWGYFTWGAGLRRLSDYQLVGDYKRWNATAWKNNAMLQAEARREGVSIKKHFIHREWKINWLYKAKGFRVAMFNDSAPYASHAPPQGRDKHVPDERGASPFE